MIHVNYEITVSPILKHNISTKKLQTNEMKLTAAYQLCDHGLSLVPVTAEKKKKKREIELELVCNLIALEKLIIIAPLR